MTTLHVYTEAEPYWIVRVFQQGASYKFVAWSAAEILAAFCSDLVEPAEKPEP